MADKPSRALVLYGDGLARSIDPSHTHLHSFTSRACCGFLSLPNSPPSETEDARIVREFAELVDASEAYLALNGEESSETQSQEQHVAATISERFMGMKAAVITENLRLKSFCNKLGFTVLELNEVISNINNQVDSSALASELFKLLGFQEGKTLESSQFDLVILHVGAGQTTNCLKDLDLVNRLVGNLVQMAHPGTEVGSRLHMSVLLSYGAVRESDDSTFSIADSRQENNSKLSLIFPRQSYTIKEGKPRPNVRQHCPILVAQWQNAVTRKDMAEAYSYEDFKEHGANLVIPPEMMKPRNSITKTILKKFKNVSNPRKNPFSSSSIPREKVDCLVIGAGIVGIAVAKELSVNHGRQVLVVDSAPIFGTGTSSRNSEVIHAGIYYPTNSLKASFCVRGKELLYKYCKDHEIPHKQIGKLIVATGLSEVPRLSNLMTQGIQNGVEGLRMMEGYEATRLEPELQCVKALWSPSSGIVDSHSLMLSLVGEAESHGTTFSYNTAVIGGHIEGNQIQIHVSGSNAVANWNGSSELDSELILIPKLVVNSAGLSAPAITKRMKGLPDGILPASHYARGCYFTLSNTKSPFKHLIYPIPEVGGLGVHVTLDLNDQVKFGPDVEWIKGIDDIPSFLNMFDYSVHEDRANQFYPAIRKYYPSLKDGSLEPGYAGIRPKLSGPREVPTDFVVQGEDIHGISGLVNLFGIESPGLTSSMAIAEDVAAKLLK